ncbi:hypothetical protein J6590_047479 [Homalodisca vitripennis]|nr:hypothetical protein J6590_047479 [Homalodisca vitripennis]
MTNLKKELELKSNLLNNMSENCEELAEKLSEQARTAHEHLKSFLKASKTALNSTRLYATNDIPDKTLLLHSLTPSVTGRTSQTPTQKLTHELTERDSQTLTQKLGYEMTWRNRQTPTKKLSHELTERDSQTLTHKLSHSMTGSVDKMPFNKRKQPSKRSDKRNFFSVSLQVAKSARISSKKHCTLTGKSSTDQ